jgi:hypothetical protein
MDSDIQVIWSAKAKYTFFKVLDYLNENWTHKEIVQFNMRTQLVIKAIKKNPAIFPVSSDNQNIRKAIVDTNNILFYKIDVVNQKIFLLTFFDCRQDPKKLI